MENIPIPSEISEITPSWIQLVTGDSPIPDSVHLEGDIQEGFGFLSSVCRVSYKTAGTPPKEHSIVVKLPPKSSPFEDFTLFTENIEFREIQFYTTIIADLVEIDPGLKDYVCKFYKGVLRPEDPSKNITRSSVLVFEDMKFHGYETMPFSGDNRPHVMHSLIDFTARLHYSCQAAALKKGKTLPELYPFMQGIVALPAWQDDMENKNDFNYTLLENLLKAENVSEGIWKRYENIKPHTRKIVELVENKGREMACLIHSDIWPGNVMCHESKPVTILDWQQLSFRDPLYDLALPLYSVVLKEQLTMDTVRALLREYWETYEKLCEKGEYANKIKRRSFEETEKFLFTWATAFAFLLFLPSIEACEKDRPKYANMFRFMCEDVGLPEFLHKASTES